ncbi:hypothetical protein [Cutibacterium modestum]|uniref:hypothetical protein n=1 Tax=Cutibacterium modestum TaxID=2559073 RepID=UPI001414D9BB|nr:hypothetical protein [Cutibacterium modestum]
MSSIVYQTQPTCQIGHVTIPSPERHATRPQLVHVIAAVVAVKAPQSRGSPSMQTAIAAP